MDPSGIARSWWIRLCRLCLTCSSWTLLLLLCTALRRLIPRDLRLLASHSYNVYCHLLHVLILLRRECHILIFRNIVNIFRYVVRSKRKGKGAMKRVFWRKLFFLKKCGLQFSFLRYNFNSVAKGRVL